MVNEPTYRPRGDFVLIREVKVDKFGGLVMPQISAQGKKMVVVCCGPKVEDLKPGDQVILAGKIGQDHALLPNHSDLLLTREANCVCIVEDSGEELT